MLSLFSLKSVCVCVGGGGLGKEKEPETKLQQDWVSNGTISED